LTERAAAHDSFDRVDGGVVFPEDVSVAKILVADDNSNIQKMVGLALKDHGIEVIAVGNGEAAVRKITEIRPDLVLADVFMPVRNGYEVCQFVKEDTSLAHIPVILLVGAFDPLDEAEAQRVGADGVLKKPFVPPDPLISMVKASLVRAGVAHVGFAPTPPPSAVPEPAPPLPKFSAPAWNSRPAPPIAPEESESFVEEIPAVPAPVNIESGSKPVAFGNLLNSPTTAHHGAPTEEFDAVTASQKRDWRTLDDVKEETEEPESNDTKPAWRGDSDETESELATKLGRSGQAWRSNSLDSLDENHSQQPWPSARETRDLHEAMASTEAVNDSSQSSAGSASSAPFSGEAWAAAIATESGSGTAVAEAERSEEPVAAVKAELQPFVTPETPEASHVAELHDAHRDARHNAALDAQVVAAELPAPQPEPELPSQPTVPSQATSWFSTPPSPWESEARKLNELASSWDATAAAEPANATPVDGSMVMSAPDEIEVVSSASVAAENSFEHIPHTNSPTMGTEEARTSVPQTQVARPDVDIDVLVEKVIARLNPDVLQELAARLLRPIVEETVREELAAHKR
jgi:CheY-like chemotaxis protein